MLADIPDELRAQAPEGRVDAYRALRVRDYGRVDLRLTETGRDLRHRGQRELLPGEGERVRHGGEAAGIEFPELVQRIVELAVERHSVGYV